MGDYTRDCYEPPGQTENEKIQFIIEHNTRIKKYNESCDELWDNPNLLDELRQHIKYLTEQIEIFKNDSSN